MKVKLFTISDSAFFDELKRQSIIGMFDRVFIEKEPGALSRASFSGVVEGLKKDEEYDLLVSLTDPNSNVIISKDFSVKSSNYGSISFVVNFNVIPFPIYGTYSAKLLVGGKEISSFSIYAEKASQNV